MIQLKSSKLLWAGILLGIDFLAKPKEGLLAAVFILVLIDFITGITKAKLKGVARTSQGYRKTVIKLMQYVVAIIIFVGGGYFLKLAIPANPDNNSLMQVANILGEASRYVMLFIIYIEVSSIFENLYDIDSRSPFSKYFIKPILTILKFGLEKNPVTNAADKLKDQLTPEQPETPETPKP